ncbi:MAG: thymidine phosphorylase [Bacteroidota bacterium]
MNPGELIRKKRDGGNFTRDEIHFIIDAFVRNELPDYQMTPLLMAIYFQGLSVEETAWLTDEMIHSGAVIDLSDIPGIKVDKHSTGGVGDKVSLILAPIVAACGIPVPMLSGRGLSHTGGTLDKLESIPGLRTNLSVEEYRETIRDIGLVMAGPTSVIVPADKRMYSLRDVTATIDSIPLIAASIISKKLAEGIDAIVFDIKTGRGAFMSSYERAAELAQTLVNTATYAGKQTIGYITEMNQPLGRTVGNWLEVVEAIQCLRGEEVPDLMAVTYQLAGTMLMLGGKARSIEEGRELCQKAIVSGEAFKKFLRMVEKQGGDITFIEEPEKYPIASYSVDIKSGMTGFIAKIDALETGFTAVELGAGRMKVDDEIDPKAGIVFHRKVGDAVDIGDSVCTLYTDRSDILPRTKSRLARAIVFSSQRPPQVPMIRAMVDTAGVHPLV